MKDTNIVIIDTDGMLTKYVHFVDNTELNKLIHGFNVISELWEKYRYNFNDDSYWDDFDSLYYSLSNESEKLLSIGFSTEDIRLAKLFIINYLSTIGCYCAGHQCTYINIQYCKALIGEQTELYLD